MSTRNQYEYKEPTCLYLIGTLEGGWKEKKDHQKKKKKEEKQSEREMSFIFHEKDIVSFFFAIKV